MLPSTTIYDDNIMQPDESMMQNLKNYASSNNIMHTLMYGHEIKQLQFYIYVMLSGYFKTNIESMYKKKVVEISTKDKRFLFYKNSFFYEIYLKNIPSLYFQFLIKILYILSQSKNIAFDRYNIIIIYNFEYLPHPYQQQLRRIMELMYDTSRFIFTTNNLDSIEHTIKSRLFIFRPLTYVHHTLTSPLIDNCVHTIHNIINQSTLDISSLKHWVRFLSIKYIPLSSFFEKFLIRYFNYDTNQLFHIISQITYYLYLYQTGHKKDYQLECLFVSIWNIQYNSSYSVKSIQEWI